MMHIFASSIIVKLVLFGFGLGLFASLQCRRAPLVHGFPCRGLDKDSGRRSAVAVLLISLGLTALSCIEIIWSILNGK